MTQDNFIEYNNIISEYVQLNTTTNNNNNNATVTHDMKVNNSTNNAFIYQDHINLGFIPNNILPQSPDIFQQCDDNKSNYSTSSPPSSSSYNSTNFQQYFPSPSPSPYHPYASSSSETMISRDTNTFYSDFLQQYSSFNTKETNYIEQQQSNNNSDFIKEETNFLTSTADQLSTAAAVEENEDILLSTDNHSPTSSTISSSSSSSSNSSTTSTAHSGGKITTTTGGGKLVNSELRRQIHIQSEQKRRAQIKDGFEDLRNELPSCLNKKMSKVALLHRTVQHIQHLKNTHMIMYAELERLASENEQLRKFQENVLQKQSLEKMYSSL